MIEKPYLVHWSDEFDSNTDAVATLDEAQTEIDRWLDLRRREADDGWALDMTGCISVIVERVVEEEHEAPEGSSFDRCVDYHREKVPDPRDARIAALEGEVASLKGRLRETCQILVEAVGGLGPCNAEDAARRAAEVVDQFRARIAAPLRLGRGPTVEEAKAHADAQEDGHGWWLVSFDVRRHPDDEAIYFEIASIEVEDGEVFVDGMSSADGSRYTEITDAIPLNASRQPCGVGVKA